MSESNVYSVFSRKDFRNPGLGTCYTLNFDGAENIFKLGHPSEIDRLCDRMFEIAKNSCSKSTEKFFKLVCDNVKTNHLVDVLINIIKREDSSYIKWYAFEGLVSINTDYALNECIKEKLWNEKINTIYLNHIDQDVVFMFVLNQIKNNKGLNEAKSIGLSALKQCLNSKDRREKIRDAFKYILETSKNYNSAYPAENIPGNFLRFYKGSEYLEEPEVKEMFEIAFSSPNKMFKALAKELMLDIPEKITDYIHEQQAYRIMKKALENKDHDMIFYVSNNIYNNGECSKDVLTKVINELSESKCEELIRELIERSSIKRSSYCSSGGYTPLGLTDSSWEPFYDNVLTVCLIGKYTNSEYIFENIITVMMTVGQKYISSIIFDLNSNLKFGGTLFERLGVKPTDKNELIIRQSLHDFGYLIKRNISERILALVDIYEMEENPLVKKQIAFKLNKFVNTDKSWIRFEYSQHSEKTIPIVSAELGEF